MPVQEFFATSGRIASYSVLIAGDHILATDDRRCCGGMQHTVPNYGTSLGELSQRPGFRLGWAKMPGGEEILYFYDRDDDCFGYAWNVTDPQLSEWGYAPF